MNDTQALLSDIETFLSDTGMKASTFGQKAVRDWKLVPRLRNGGSVTLPNAERLRKFMDGYRATRGQGRAA